MRYVFLILLILAASMSHSQQANILSCQMMINVTDMHKALDFYIGKLEFHLKNISPDSMLATITDYAEAHIIKLHKVKKLNPTSTTTPGPCLTLQVNNLDSAVARLKSRNVNFSNFKERKEGVGRAIYCVDPFGTPVSLMQQTIVSTPYFHEPQIYNFGLLISTMDSARKFYRMLGFSERSTKYLPLDMPMSYADSGFAFMLHYRKTSSKKIPIVNGSDHLMLLFVVKDIRQFLLSHDLKYFIAEDAEEDLFFKNSLLIRDEDGIMSALIKIIE